MVGVCMRLFCVCVVLCLVEALLGADRSSKESHRVWKMITELNKRLEWAGRAIERKEKTELEI
jgi:hypothetical protein